MFRKIVVTAHKVVLSTLANFSHDEKINNLQNNFPRDKEREGQTDSAYLIGPSSTTVTALALVIYVGNGFRTLANPHFNLLDCLCWRNFATKMEDLC